jgi:hypothetical protein
MSTVTAEKFLDKRGLADFLSCSVRWIEARMAEGLPHFYLAGRVKFQPSEAVAWLEANGHIRREL